MGSAHHFSLTKYATYGVAVVVAAALIGVAACLWMIQNQHQTRDAALTELLARKNAQILSQQLVVNPQSSDDGLSQSDLEALFATDGYVSVKNAAGRTIAQIGDIDGGGDSVRAEVDVAGTDWRLEVSQRASGDILVYFFEGTPIWMALFVATALVVLGSRVLIAVAAELKNVGRFLRQIDSGPFSIDPPPCEIEETALLLPAIERIASDLHKKDQAIARLSFTDNITKLPNRLHFYDRFRHAFELAKRGNEICLLILELNEFQKTDEILGHECADAILRLLADTLQHQTRKSDFAARLGTCSFAAVFYNARASTMPSRVVQLQHDFAARQKDSAATAGEIYCTLSCAMTHVDGENDARAEEPIARVENELRRIKDLGGNQLSVIASKGEDDELPSAIASQ